MDLGRLGAAAQLGEALAGARVPHAHERAALGGGGESRAVEVERKARELRLVCGDERRAGDVEELVTLLRNVMHRNHLHVDEKQLYNDCRVGAKHAVEAYRAEVVAALRWLQAANHPRLPPKDKIEFFQRCSVCLGNTALCLSGGGALAMYHMGVVRALLEAKAMPAIVSGASGGSIVAGVLAVHTDEEMLQDIITDDIATAGWKSKLVPTYTSSVGHVWFPPLSKQFYSYAKHGCLVENDGFASCTQRYYGDFTFQEAFERTGRVVNINVSSRSLTGSGRRGALLLNHLTTPHVLIRSAVHASCALPTVMHSAALLAKDATGAIVPFGHGGDGARFIDGSYTADIPRKRLAELFHVTQDIVSQVNPHIVASAEHELSTSELESSVLRRLHRLEGFFSGDVMYRLQTLGRLGLLPAMFGDGGGGRQRRGGDVTIFSFGWSAFPACIWRAIQNPSPEMMHGYIKDGRAAAWRQLSHIEHRLAIELQLRSSLEALLGVEGAGVEGHGGFDRVLKMQLEAASPSSGYGGGSGSGSPRSARREGGDEDRLKELLREEREKVAASEAKRVELEGVLRRMVAEAGGVLG